MSSKRVVVVGAGVIGLTCALRLQSAGYKVFIVARDIPGELSVEYASPWAGAHFRPISVTNAAEALERKLSQETYDHFLEVATNDESAGISFCPGVEYFDDPSKAYTDLNPSTEYSTWPGFRVLEATELPLSAKWGVRYNAWVLNSPAYLVWLVKQLTEAVILRKTISSLPEAVSVVREAEGNLTMTIHAVINASGMGFLDAACSPSRGQFLLVSNDCDRTISHHRKDGESTVVVPRPGGGGTLIGGSKEPGNWSPEPSDETTARIIQRVSELCPQMLTLPADDLTGKPELHLLRVNIGRRPMRKGGLRLERELIEMDVAADGNTQTNTTRLNVIHCYGAGGSGFKISWGAARMVAELAEDS